MNKKDFCSLLFRYIDDGFTILDIETSDFIYGFDFERDNLFLGQKHFIVTQGLLRFEINYKDVKRVSC